jgi:hypothetical protein
MYSFNWLKMGYMDQILKFLGNKEVSQGKIWNVWCVFKNWYLFFSWRLTCLHLNYSASLLYTLPQVKSVRICIINSLSTVNFSGGILRYKWWSGLTIILTFFTFSPVSVITGWWDNLSSSATYLSNKNLLCHFITWALDMENLLHMPQNWSFNGITLLFHKKFDVIHGHFLYKAKQSQVKKHP